MVGANKRGGGRPEGWRESPYFLLRFVFDLVQLTQEAGAEARGGRRTREGGGQRDLRPKWWPAGHALLRACSAKGEPPTQRGQGARRRKVQRAPDGDQVRRRATRSQSRARRPSPRQRRRLRPGLSPAHGAGSAPGPSPAPARPAPEAFARAGASRSRGAQIGRRPEARRRPSPEALPAGSVRPPRRHGAAASLHAAAGPRTPRFVCYCEGEGGGPGERRRLQPLVGVGPPGLRGRGARPDCPCPAVTDAAELWSTCLTPDRLAALVGNGAPGWPGGPPAPHTCSGPPVGSQGAAWNFPEVPGAPSHGLCSCPGGCGRGRLRVPRGRRVSGP